MISGDIDLTKDLDFYRDKKPKELPSVVPWEDNELELNSDESATINNISSIEYYNYDNFELNGINFNITYTNYNSSTTNNFSIRTSNNYINSIYEYYLEDDYTSNISHYSTTNKFNISYNPGKYKKKYPWDSRKIKSKQDAYFNHKDAYIRSKLWDNFLKSRERYFKFNSYHNYPWNTKEKKRKDKIIPWLKNLNRRIYNDYMKDLYEEQDYSEYLTNMGWLGIH